MTKRCRHEIETKPGYPDDLLCQKCQTIWSISECMGKTPKEAMLLPKAVRYEVLKRQAEKFAKENPDYYKEQLDG